MRAQVIQTTGSWYLVRLHDGREVRCKVKGRFRLQGIRSTNPVAVGDEVEITENPEAAYITQIAERRNYIVRRASNLSKQSHILAANVDLALLFVTVARPETSTTFIDRFLASAEAYRVPVILLFNKADDVQNDAESETRSYLLALYRHIGYTCLDASATTGQGVDEIRRAVAGKTVLLAGHSGVGKTTWLNRLIPGVEARTSAISEAHGTGMHTTTASTLYPLPAAEGGGALIDVPGVKGFGSFNMEKEEVSHYFRDIFALSEHCKFQNCTHTHEPSCAVLEALEAHRLAPSRYASYLSMMEDEEEGKYRAGY